jgi:hypothetical protein
MSVVKQRKGILRKVTDLSRGERSKLRALAESLKNEFEPQNPYEEFVFEKLIVDFGRLTKLYEFEKKRVFDQEHGLGNYIAESYADRFIRYKNSIEKDIKDGYARLEELKKYRE